MQRLIFEKRIYRDHELANEFFSSRGAEQMKTQVEDFYCKFYVCASYVKPYCLEAVELIGNAEVTSGTYLGELKRL
jgi:hypothetical protein